MRKVRYSRQYRSGRKPTFRTKGLYRRTARRIWKNARRLHGRKSKNVF